MIGSKFLIALVVAFLALSLFIENEVIASPSPAPSPVPSPEPCGWYYHQRMKPEKIEKPEKGLNAEDKKKLKEMFEMLLSKL